MGYLETNLDIGYKITPEIKAQLSVYKLFDSHAYSAEYFYATDITQAEVVKYGTVGEQDDQVHLLERSRFEFRARRVQFFEGKG